MKTKRETAVSAAQIDQPGEVLTSRKELAQRLAEVERRVAVHDEILNFLKTILEQLTESGYRLVLTEAQRAELNRWLDGYEKEGRLSRPKVN